MWSARHPHILDGDACRVAGAIALGLAGITAWSWRGVTPHPGGPPPPDELLAAARTSPDTLIVDFRDDITNQALAARGYVDEPISRFSATDRMYRIRFPTPQEAEDAARRLRADPMVESVDYDAPVSLFPEDGTPMAPPVDAPECANDDRATAKVQASPTIPASATSGTCSRSGCPRRGSWARAAGSWWR